MAFPPVLIPPSSHNRGWGQGALYGRKGHRDGHGGPGPDLRRLRPARPPVAPAAAERPGRGRVSFGADVGGEGGDVVQDRRWADEPGPGEREAHPGGAAEERVLHRPGRGGEPPEERLSPACRKHVAASAEKAAAQPVERRARGAFAKRMAERKPPAPRAS